MAKAEIEFRGKDKTKGAFRSLDKNIKSTNGALGALAGKLAAAAGAAGIGMMIKQQIDLADQTGKAAQMLGLQTEALSKLRFAAEQTGVSNQVLEKGLKNMVRVVSEATEGTGLAVDSLKALGLEANDLANMDADQMFAEISEAIKGVESDTKQLQIAYELFGGRGTELIRTMELGREGLAAYGKEAEQLGIVISSKAAKESADFNDKLNVLKKSSNGATQALVTKLLPALLAIAGTFEKAVKADSFFDSLGETISRALFPDKEIVKKKVLELQDEIEILEESMKTRAKTKEGFFGFLVSDAAIAATKARLIQAREELKGFTLLEAENKTETPATVEEDPQVTRNQQKIDLIAEQEATQRAIKLQEDAIFFAESLAMVRAYEEAQVKIKEMSEQNKLALTQSAFGALASLMQQGGKKAFKAYQAFALAETWVSTYSAAQSAADAQLKFAALTSDPTGPVKAKIAAGIAYASGAARAAAILKQKPGGGGGGGGGGGVSGGGGIPPLPTDIAPGRQAASITISGDNFSADGVRQLINSINDALDDGAKLNVQGA